MILKRIVEFAERELKGQPSGYQPRLVTKCVELDTDGKLIGVTPLTGDKRGKREGKIRQEPQESPMRTVAIRPRLVADNVNYVLGMVKEGDKPDKVAERHQTYGKAVTKAYETTQHGGLRAVHLWLLSGGAESLRHSGRIDPDDEITFRVAGEFVTDDPVIQRYWANQSEAAGEGQCIITGEYGPVVDRMPAPIKGVPDGQMSGTAIVSVNNKAGESYGLEAALNSPISPAAAELLCNGLNKLINERVPDTDASGKEIERGKYALRVGRGLFIAWTRKESEFNVFQILDRPDPDQVRRLIQSVHKSGGLPKVDAADFYLLSLSANAARIVIRDYLETSLPQVEERLGRWFARLRLINTKRELGNPPSVYRLATSLYRDASRDMPARVPEQLIRSIFTGSPLPGELLGLAIKRNLAMQGPYTLTKNKTRVLDTSRLALLKAALTPDPKDETLIMLNREHPSPAYQCGRLLSVLESIQTVAVPGINATLVDRYYGAACASPASVFPNLLKDATSAHLPKLRKNKPGAHRALDRRLTEIVDRVTVLPKTLSLHAQGEFSLGYYHQRADDIAEAIKNKELKDLAEVTARTGEEE